MNTENQTSFRKLLTDRIEELEGASQRNRDLEAANENPTLNIGYNCMASSLLDTAHELKNTLQMFNQYADPSDSELNARLALMQAHGESLQNILLASGPGMKKVMDAIKEETEKLTTSIYKLKGKCKTIAPSWEVSYDEAINPGRPAAHVGHMYEPEPYSTHES